MPRPVDPVSSLQRRMSALKQRLTKDQQEYNRLEEALAVLRRITPTAVITPKPKPGPKPGPKKK